MKGRSQKWLGNVASALRPEQRTGGKPLVEILGYERVLIENHIQVLDYQPCRIRVRVCYGEVCISGAKLRFARVSAEQLIITGMIESVTLARG